MENRPTNAFPFLKRTSLGFEISVKVVPGSSKTGISGVLGDALKIRVSAPPEDGKANKAVMDILSEKTGFQVEIMSGFQSSRKRFLVTCPTTTTEIEIARLLEV